MFFFIIIIINLINIEKNLILKLHEFVFNKFFF